MPGEHIHKINLPPRCDFDCIIDMTAPVGVQFKPLIQLHYAQLQAFLGGPVVAARHTVQIFMLSEPLKQSAFSGFDAALL